MKLCSDDGNRTIRNYEDISLIWNINLFLSNKNADDGGMQINFILWFCLFINLPTSIFSLLIFSNSYLSIMHFSLTVNSPIFHKYNLGILLHNNQLRYLFCPLSNWKISAINEIWQIDCFKITSEQTWNILNASEKGQTHSIWWQELPWK